MNNPRNYKILKSKQFTRIVTYSRDKKIMFIDLRIVKFRIKIKKGQIK